MDRTSIFKPSLGEVKNWPARLVSKQDCETSLRWVKNELMRLVSKEVKNQWKSNFQI